MRYRRLAKKYNGDVWIHALTVRPDEPLREVNITLHFFLPTIARPDRDNAVGWMKHGFDALQRAGVIVDDKFVTHGKPTFQKDADNPRVEMEIVALPPEPA